MKKSLLLFGTLVLLSSRSTLSAHCQMPCGIYHDDLVFNQVDQYIETMNKGIAVINNSPFTDVRDRTETIRWVMQKEKESDQIANLITTYFLQQKIKPGEAETPKRLTSAHKLLFSLVAIKQNNDSKFVKDFANEWESFKQMFVKPKQNLSIDANHDHEHDHDHDHDHDHTH